MSHPTTPGNTTSAIGDSVDSEVTKAGETSHDNAVNSTHSKPDHQDQKLSTLETTLLLVSVFLSMFLVAVDRTIISTVRVHSLEQSYQSGGLHCRAARYCAEFM